MRVSILVAVLSAFRWGAHGFSPVTLNRRTASVARQTELFSHKKNDKAAANPFAGLVVAATLFTSSLVMSPTTPFLPTPPVANAVEISSGAFSIQTSTEKGQSLLNAEVDTGSLLRTILKNRKALTASFDRIQTAVKQELTSPVWTEVSKEILRIEGDVVPDIKVTPPSDLTQTFRDITKGKLNFIFNGEIINISVDPKFGKEENALMIRIEGFKGVDLAGIAPTSMTESIGNVYALRWQERFSKVSDAWNTPVGYDLPDGTPLTAGPLVAGGLVGTIVAAYGGSYAYYTQQQEKEKEVAEERRKAMAAKRAAAVQKPKQEDDGN